MRPVWSQSFRELSVFVSLSLSLLLISVSPTLSHPLAQSQAAYRQSALYNLWRRCSRCYTTTAQSSAHEWGIILLSGLFHSISDLPQGCHWQETKKRSEEKWWMDLFRNWQDWMIRNERKVSGKQVSETQWINKMKMKSCQVNKSRKHPLEENQVLNVKLTLKNIFMWKSTQVCCS